MFTSPTVVSKTGDEPTRTEAQAYLVEKLGSLNDINDEQLLKELPEEDQKQLTEAESSFAKLNDSVMSSEDIRMVALEDICWVMLNRNEFLFNH